MRIVLHIGTDKTGSTAIQQHLTLNRDWFRHKSVYIPELGFGRGNGHSALLRNLDRENLEMLRGEVDAASDAGFKVFLLSWEGMNFYSLEQIQRLRAILSGYEISVLVYLREQADIIQTGLLQYCSDVISKSRLRFRAVVLMSICI